MQPRFLRILSIAILLFAGLFYGCSSDTGETFCENTEDCQVNATCRNAVCVTNLPNSSGFLEFNQPKGKDASSTTFPEQDQEEPSDEPETGDEYISGEEPSDASEEFPETTDGQEGPEYEAGPTVCQEGETRPCYTGPKGTKGVGACQEGSQTCSSNTWSKCAGETLPSKEVCDKKDNDCDGKIDEEFPTLGNTCSAGVGECQKGGELVCNEKGTGVHCNAKAGKPQSSELCNGKDDDCDGKTDEDFISKLGKECSEGKGECEAKGKTVCSPDGKKVECNAKPKPPSKDLCNGKDDDCNGKIDEGYPSRGKACTMGKGECKRKGTYRCLANGYGVECDAKPGAPIQELCNGRDDDCDGQTDEDFANQGKSCAAGKGICLNHGTLDCSKDKKSLVCSAVPKKGLSTDPCDGLDNDCDGTVDEGCKCKNGDKRSCSSNLGICTKGYQYCDSKGQWGKCSGVTPKTEECNGKDDNCDGNIDETFTGKGHGCRHPKLKGPCERGIYKCIKGIKICHPNVLPGTEQCNGKDDDCDGQVDETYSEKGQACSVPGKKGVCIPGTKKCERGKIVCHSNLKPSKEICDGKDNDCDGATDEDFPLLKQVCYAGLGECKRSGTYRCKSDNRGVECSAKPGHKTKEICDGKDNNCDGRIDEYFTYQLGKACSKGLGECLSTGKMVCKPDGSTVICNAVAKPSSTELCDGKDNDCDGRVDENFTRLRRPCRVGKGICENTGIYICNPTKKTEVMCSVKPGQPGTETCDGKDNDCDGTVDEGCACTPGKTEACYTGTSGCKGGPTYTCQAPCKTGTRTCNKVQGGSAWGSCVGEVKPATEVCNGKDDNCDGKTDETDPDVGKSCVPDPQNTCFKGKKACKGGRIVCEKLAPPAEICGDNIDNDCDKQIDENCGPKYPYIIAKSSGGHIKARDLSSSRKAIGQYSITPSNATQKCGDYPFFLTHGGSSIFTSSIKCSGNNFHVKTVAVSGRTFQSVDKTFHGAIPSLKIGTNSETSTDIWGIIETSKCRKATANDTYATCTPVKRSSGGAAFTVQRRSKGIYYVSSTACSTVGQPIFANIFHKTTHQVGYIVVNVYAATRNCLVYTFDGSGSLADRNFAFWIPDRTKVSWVRVATDGVTKNNKNNLDTSHSWTVSRNTRPYYYKATHNTWAKPSAIMAANRADNLTPVAYTIGVSYTSTEAKLYPSRISTRNLVALGYTVMFIH